MKRSARPSGDEGARFDEEDAAPAPNRPPIDFRHTRAFGVFGWVLVFVAAWLFACAFEIYEHHPITPIYFVVPTAVALAPFAVLFLDRLTWRALLGFPVDGYERIEGTVARGFLFLPIAEIAVRVELVDKAASAAPFLDALAVRGHAWWHRFEGRDKLTPFTVVDDAAGRASANGTAPAAIYAARVFEQWLRKDVKRLAREHRVARVSFDARYTDRTVLVDT